MREYWSYCGEVADMDLMRFPDTGRFKGIAFITFATVRLPTALGSVQPHLSCLYPACVCDCTTGMRTGTAWHEA